MNFSNFFIDVLSGTDSALTMGSKKNASPAFMFSDIMKVCEEENSNIAALGISSNGNVSELFAATDTVINISPEDLTVLTQMLSSLMQVSGDPQPTETTYQVDEAKITKQQFIIPETKLVDLLSDLIEKGNFPIASLNNPMQSGETNKPMTFAFKSGTNKVSITFNPIKIDENYSATVINDEYSFVNKLIVKEGLFENPVNNLNAEGETKLTENSTDVKQDEAIPVEEESTSTKTEQPAELFFKTEIIKIINTNPQSDIAVSSISLQPKTNESTITSFLAYKDLVADQNSSSESMSEIGQSTQNKIEAGSAENTLPVIDKKLSEGNENTSFASLLDGLTEEEKSVFKNSADSVEQKQFGFKKETGENSVKVSEPVNPDVKQSADSAIESASAAAVESKNAKTTEQLSAEVIGSKTAKISVKGSLKSSAKTEDETGEVKQTVKEFESELNKVSGKSVTSSVTGTEKKSIAETKTASVDEKTLVNPDKADSKSEVGEVKKEKSSLSGNIDAQKSTKNVNDEQELVNTKTQIETNKKAAELLKSSTGKIKGEEVAPQEVNVKTTGKDEKTTSSKDDIEIKDSVANELKNAKQTARGGNSDLSPENDSTKHNGRESFKNTLTSAISNEFDTEKTKAFSEVKIPNETFKTLKQSEIIPEFSKIIQQGEKQTMTFQLSPENLGKIKLVVDLVQNQIQTRIEVENDQVKQFMQSNLEQLKQNLESNGIHLSNLNVSLADYSQKNSSDKVFTPKKKTILGGDKEIVTEEISEEPLRKMGYNTYEFLA